MQTIFCTECGAKMTYSGPNLNSARLADAALEVFNQKSQKKNLSLNKVDLEL